MSQEKKVYNEGLRAWQQALDQFSHESIAKNMGYVVFYVVLALVYITNNNKSVLFNSELNQQYKKLKELQWEYTDLQSQIMYQTSETELLKLSENLGLGPSEYPVFEIRVKPENN